MQQQQPYTEKNRHGSRSRPIAKVTSGKAAGDNDGPHDEDNAAVSKDSKMAVAHISRNELDEGAGVALKHLGNASDGMKDAVLKGLYKSSQQIE